MGKLLSFQDIEYTYRGASTPALDSVTWDARTGRTVLLGPNGAGKTTLLAIAAGVMAPRHGRVRLEGPEVGLGADALRRHIGYMPQHVRAVPGLTCREQVAYMGWLKGMSTRSAWEAAAASLADVGLQSVHGRAVSQLSGGQLRRVGLAQALVTGACFLLLDEPTAGLDPAQRSTFRDVLARLPADNVVVISTHQVDDLAESYSTVAVLHEGRLRFEGEVSSFLALAPPDAVRPAEAAYLSLIGGDLG